MSDARSFWKKHVVGWRASGETAKRYSARHGLSANSLGWWSSRLKRDGELAEAAMQWAKVEVTAATALRPIVIRVGDVRSAVERGFDVETLTAIFAVLDRRSA
ncbi:MAG TPA: hypothetical protein VMJ10_33390 [Kofleriaceae bacterium]|nr:hypothetical protein [Kofleriaceae bacterium]